MVRDKLQRKFWINEPGKYEFRLISDDGSKLYIDGRVRIDNDGLHLPVSITATANLTGGIHTIRVSYCASSAESVGELGLEDGQGTYLRP